MEEKEKKRDCIMLNKMYVGTYLSSKNNNIGHEVINLLQTDKGENYISAMPYSTIANDKIGRIKTVLLVRSHTEKLLEILAKAEIEKEIVNEKNEFDYSFQKEYIEGKHNEDKHKEITYNGKYLHEIYAENNNFGNGKGSLITFKVNDIRRVKNNERLYITTSNDVLEKYKKIFKHIFFIGNINFPKQEHKTYFSPTADITGTAKNNQEAYINAYEKLKEIIYDSDYLWEETNTTQKINNKYIEKLLENEDYSMIDILDKKDAENTYSNFFYHIFESNHKLFQKFANDILNITDMSDNFAIVREEYRIDLLIYDEKNVVVIENKIKSDINGKLFDDNGNLKTTQLEKYYKDVTKQPDFKGKDKEEKIEEWKNKFGTKENKKFFIFAPKYNKLASDKIIKLNGYQDDDEAFYTIITYDELLEFFKKVEKEAWKSIPYYPEFMYALEKHSESTDNHYEKEILKRFVKVIKRMTESDGVA